MGAFMISGLREMDRPSNGYSSHVAATSEYGLSQSHEVAKPLNQLFFVYLTSQRQTRIPPNQSKKKAVPCARCEPTAAGLFSSSFSVASDKQKDEKHEPTIRSSTFSWFSVPP